MAAQHLGELSCELILDTVFEMRELEVQNANLFPGLGTHSSSTLFYVIFFNGNVTFFFYQYIQQMQCNISIPISCNFGILVIVS